MLYVDSMPRDSMQGSAENRLPYRRGPAAERGKKRMYQEVKGEYNTARIYTDVVEDTALAQIKSLCDQEYVKDLRIRIMPDVHAGAGCTIGTTMTIRDAVAPNLVGVDIGCGMETIRIKNRHIEREKLDKLILEKIPSGYEVRKKPHSLCEQIDLEQLRCKKEARLDLRRAALSLGTLGGGNHFIEADQDQEGKLYLVVHSGSRHLGLEVAQYYQEQAYRELNGNTKKDEKALIATYRAQGRKKEIERALKALKKQIKTSVPKSLAYCTGALMEDYIHDMKLVQQFAMLNRKAMMDELIRGMKLKVEEEFTTIHNYIDTDAGILRKGAVSAKKGEKLLIPINMRDGSLLCVGKGNEEWNFSAPHGAGRLMSRAQAKKTWTVSEFKKQMKGIYTTSVNGATLDECPMAYKGMEDIVRNIGDTAEIVKVIRPVYNFKAGEE